MEKARSHAFTSYLTPFGASPSPRHFAVTSFRPETALGLTNRRSRRLSRRAVDLSLGVRPGVKGPELVALKVLSQTQVKLMRATGDRWTC